MNFDTTYKEPAKFQITRIMDQVLTNRRIELGLINPATENIVIETLKKKISVAFSSLTAAHEPYLTLNLPPLKKIIKFYETDDVKKLLSRIESETTCKVILLSERQDIGIKSNLFVKSVIVIPLESSDKLLQAITYSWIKTHVPSQGFSVVQSLSCFNQENLVIHTHGLLNPDSV